MIACLDFPGAGTLRAFLRSYLLRFGRLLSWVFWGGVGGDNDVLVGRLFEPPKALIATHFPRENA